MNQKTDIHHAKKKRNVWKPFGQTLNFFREHRALNCGCASCRVNQFYKKYEQMTDNREAALIKLYNEHGELLLLDRNSPPFGYGLPGGKIDPTDDSIIDGLVREINEEIGIDYPNRSITFIKTAQSENGRIVHIFMGLMAIDNNEVQITSEHKGYIFTKNPTAVSLAGKTESFLT